MVQTALGAFAEEAFDNIGADTLHPSESDSRRRFPVPMQYRKDRNAAEIGHTCGGWFIEVKTGYSHNVRDNVHSWPMRNAHDPNKAEEHRDARSTGKHSGRILKQQREHIATSPCIRKGKQRAAEPPSRSGSRNDSASRDSSRSHISRVSARMGRIFSCTN